MFKHAAAYRLIEGAVDLAAFGEALGRQVFQPCSAESAESCGWVETVAGAGLAGCQADGQVLVTLRVESKVVPGSTLKSEVNKRVAEIADKEGRKVGRKEQREIKEAVLAGLLVRALPCYKSVRAWIDTRDGWVVVDSGSAKMVDLVLSALRNCLESAACRLVKTVVSPSAGMAGWLTEGEAPAGFTVDMECSLKGAEGQTVRFAKHSLEGQVVKHLEEGKVPVALGMTYKDRASFVLAEDGKLKKLTFVDALLAAHKEEAANCESATDAALVNLVFMGGELRQMLPAVVGILGGEMEVNRA